MRMKKLLFLLATMLATSFGLLAQGTSWQTATLITSGSTMSGALDNNTTEAWYKINVTQEGHVDLDVTATGNLTFGSCSVNGYWDDALRNYAGFNGYGTAHATSNIVDAGRGTYYIRIARYGGSGTFSLKYTFTACSLSNDPEPNEEYQQNSLLQSGRTVQGRLGYRNSENVTDNVDWYRIEVPQEGHVDITVIGTETLRFGSCNVNGYWDDALRNYGGFAGYSTNTVTYNAIDVGRGTYYIKIERYGGSGGYTLNYTFTPCSLSNDPEPNGDYQNNSLLQNGTRQGRLGYRNSENVIDNEDWYRIEVPQEGHVDIIATGTETLRFGSCNVFGYWNDAIRDYGGFAGYSTDSVTYNSISVAPGTYYIRIARYNGSGGYRLKYTFTPCPLANDPEPNGDYQHNSLVQNGTHQGRLGYRNSENVIDNEDWYRIEVPQEGHVDIIATGTETLRFGSCNVFGYWNDAIRDYGGFSGYSTDTVTYSSIGVGPGTYYIRIARYNGSGGYKLNYTFTPCQLANDMEPNQDYQSAAWLPSGRTMQGRMGHRNSENVTDNEDWYRFNVNKAGNVEFTATGTETLRFGSCTVYGVRDDGSLFSKGSFSGYSTPTATFSGTNYDVGTYYVRIARYDGSGGYRLTYNGPSITGDVNSDNKMDISDVSNLIDNLLGANDPSFFAPDADVNGDGIMDINDVTALIDFLLTSK